MALPFMPLVKCAGIKPPAGLSRRPELDLKDLEVFTLPALSAHHVTVYGFGLAADFYGATAAAPVFAVFSFLDYHSSPLLVR